MMMLKRAAAVVKKGEGEEAAVVWLELLILPAVFQ
jgi:hypothetical protein